MSSNIETNQSTSGGLEIRDLDFSRSGQKILQGIDLQIPVGQFVCLLGPSGCGKTTLLRLLAGLEHPDTGNLLWQGNQIIKPSLDRGVVFQDYSLFPWMTVRDNISLAIRKAKPEIGKKESIILAENYLELVGLHDCSKKYPFELSGGMRQRGAIARALAVDSKILLMDEPFGALDPLNRAKLQDLLVSIWADALKRITVVFVTHDVEEAVYIGDRVVMLGSTPGRVIADLPVPFARPRSRASLFAAYNFTELCEEIEETFRRDMMRGLEAENMITGKGEGI